MIRLPAYALLEIPLLFTLAFMLVMDPLWRHTLGAAFVRLSHIELHAKFIHWAPFGFLGTVNEAVETAIANGKAKSERGVVYAYNQLIDSIGVYVAGPFLLAYAVKELADWSFSHIGKTVTRVEVHKITRTVTNTAKVAAQVTRKEFTKVQNRVTTLEHEVTHLTRAAAGAIAAPFPRLGRLERSVENQAKQLARSKWLLKYGTLVALGTALLRALKIGWVRCPKVGRVGNFLCNKMDDGLLSSLLQDAALVTATISLLEFADEMGQIIQPMAEGVAFLAGVAEHAPDLPDLIP